MARHFYAFEHRYGQVVADRAGRSIGAVYAFTSEAARDRFVGLGPARTSEPRFREPIGATSREVRSARRADYWSVEDGDAALAERLGAD